MSIKLPKLKHYLFLLAIILTNVVIMQDFVIYPVVNSLYEVFSDNVGGVNFILSGPYIFMSLASLMVPFLLKFVNKKTLLAICCAVFTVCAVGGIAILSVPYMIAVRCICGLCYGVVQVVALDIVADYFIDEDKRASFMGIFNAAMAAIGAALGMVAGNLAVSDWKNAYLTYWIAVPMTILVIFFVPNLRPAAQIQNDEEQQSINESPLGIRFWIAIITFFIFNICSGVVSTYAAVYIAENELGNEAVSGLATSLSTIGSCVCCLGFGFLYSKLKARASLICYTVLAFSLLIMAFLPNQLLFLAICTLCGGAYGILFSYMYAHIPNIVDPQNISRAISIITACTGLAGFGGTYVITGLMEITAEPTIAAVSLVLGIVLAVTTIVEVFNTGRNREVSQS